MPVLAAEIGSALQRESKGATCAFGSLNSKDNLKMADDDEKAHLPNTGGAAIAGILDCLFAFGVILADSGIVSRQKLADDFGFVVQQLHTQSKVIAASQVEFDARVMPAMVLAKMFATPVISGPIVIEGGKSGPEGDDPPPAAA